MSLGNLIPGVPAGVSYAIVGTAVLILLLHGVKTVQSFAKMIANFGKSKPKPVNIGTILN